MAAAAERGKEPRLQETWRAQQKEGKEEKQKKMRRTRRKRRTWMDVPSTQQAVLEAVEKSARQWKWEQAEAAEWCRKA